MQWPWGRSMLQELEQRQGGKEGWRRPGGPELHSTSRATGGPMWVFAGSLRRLSEEQRKHCRSRGVEQGAQGGGGADKGGGESGWIPDAMAEPQGL